VSFLPAPLQPLFDKAQTLRASLTTPQLLILAGTFVGVLALVVGSAWYLNAPTYRVLFNDLDAESASQVVDKLAAQNVRFQLTDGGRTVLVPAERVDTLRLQFAGEGLPVGGRIGFELFDKTAFGQTEFLEHVNFRRALEGELARTIQTIAEVQAARVHIAMAKESLFGAKEQPAKASVVLTLKGNRVLPPQTSQAIAALIAASVEGLRQDQVVLVDSFGRALVRGAQGDNDALAGADLEYRERIERDIGTRVVALLEPVVGVERVRVTVSARLHGDSEEQTEERWDPSPVIRSRQVTTETQQGQGMAGVAGARANLPPVVQPDGELGPPVTPPAVATGGAGLTRSSEVSNYEVGRITRHTVRPRGELASLSVAVIVDDEVKVAVGQDGAPSTTRRPRDAGEMQKLQGLVAAAVGIDPARGDQVTVENIAFDVPFAEPEPAPTTWQQVTEHAGPTLRVVALLLMIAMVLLLFVRPVVSRVLALPAGVPQASIDIPHQLPRTIEEIEGEIEAQLDAEGNTLMDRRKPVLTRKVTTMASTEPAAAAKLVRSWLTEGKN
jgi:flagellar M-ring protein FliF